MLLVEFKLGGTFLVILMAEFVEFFGQNRLPTIEDPCPKVSEPYG